MIEIKHMKKGSYMLHKGEPARVTNLGIVVTGTHSHTKAKVSIQGLFSGKNETFTLPPHERVQDVEIIRKSAQVIAATGDTLQIMDGVSYETFNATPIQGVEVAEGDEITYVSFNGAFHVIEKRGA